MVVEIFLQKLKQTQNWEDTNQEVTEKSHRKREVENEKKNIKQRKEKIKKRVPYEGDETEWKRMHTLLNEKGEMIKHLISRWHVYSKISDTSDKVKKISKQNSETDETI